MTYKEMVKNNLLEEKSSYIMKINLGKLSYERSIPV